jgi:hypothetical protein
MTGAQLWPSDVELVEVTWGKGISTAGQPIEVSLRVAAVLQGTEYLLWAMTGDPWMPFKDTLTLAPGTAGSTLLPATDQPGWLDSGGHSYIGWAYEATIEYRRDRSVTRLQRTFTLPTGSGPIDLDRFTDEAIGSPIIGTTRYVMTVNGIAPDGTGNVNTGGGSGTSADGLILAHIADTTPHPAYDNAPDFATKIRSLLA